MDIKKNLSRIQDRIDRAAQVAGRNPSDVKLIVVSKAQPMVKIYQAIEAGATHFGENYPEESRIKILELGNHPEVKWHMIGHLQSRKSNIVAEYFHVMHSVDSIEIALKLDRKLELLGKTLPILLEMNVGGEASKYGWNAFEKASWPQLLGEVNKLRMFPRLQICGLMTMPPFMEDGELARPYFKKLRQLRDYLQGAFPKLNLSELSMGTSVDFEVAIQEGATYVRIGQAILGDRDYKNK